VRGFHIRAFVPPSACRRNCVLDRTIRLLVRMRYDYIIVGGGVAGGVLAGLLGRGGKNVLVLEKSVTSPTLVRPEIVWPATTAVLRSLIPADRLAADTLLPLGRVELRAGNGDSLDLPEDFISRRGIERCSLEPNVLRTHLLDIDRFELRRGVEVTGLVKHSGRVVGVRARDLSTSRENEFLAPCTVGNDGVHSFVRRECGISMRTRLFPIDFLCFGFDWPAAIPRPTTRVWLNTTALDSGVLGMFALPLVADKGVGLIAVRPAVFEHADRAQQGWERLRAIDDCIAEVVGGREFPGGFVRVRRPWGHARRYGVPGAVLMGDASHPVSPVGGQGTNMAVADAATFAELALENVANLHTEFERLRRPANTRSMGFTRTAAPVLRLPASCIPNFAVDLVVRWLCRNPSTLVNAILHSSTAFESSERRPKTSDGRASCPRSPARVKQPHRRSPRSSASSVLVLPESSAQRSRRVRPRPGL